MNKSFAIFDLDGTLVDSMQYWEGLALEFLKQKGMDHISPEMMKHIQSMTLSESATVLVREYHLNQTPKSVIDEMTAMMNCHYCDDIPLKPNVEHYLYQLHKKGVKMCVASSTPLCLIEACLKRLDVLSYFEFLLSCEQVGAGKTQPTIYHQAAKQLGSVASEIAVYEDALFAIKTAKTAGYYVIGVYENTSKQDWNEIVRWTDETIYNF